MSGRVTERKTIRQLRQERGWTQLDLAVRLGVSTAAVSKWERGLAAPRWKHLRHLALLFGITDMTIAADLAQHTPNDRL